MAVEQEAICCAGLLIPLLLFADDIAMPSRMFPILRCLAHSVNVFCDRNLLSINLGKMEWIVRGQIPWSEVQDLMLWYKGALVKRVPSYKYLGLVFDGSSSMLSATLARLTAA